MIGRSGARQTMRDKRRVAGAAAIRRGLAVVASLVVALVVAACAMDGRPCAPDDYRFCECPAGGQGYAQCAEDGSGYGPCDCSGTIPAGAGLLVEAGAPDADAAVEGGLAGFLEPCSEDDECVTHLCFPFNAYGPHCSQPCTKDTDCPPPSPGCSGMGVCKVH